jgi:hypothetical protein
LIVFQWQSLMINLGNLTCMLFKWAISLINNGKNKLVFMRSWWCLLYSKTPSKACCAEFARRSNTRIQYHDSHQKLIFALSLLVCLTEKQYILILLSLIWTSRNRFHCALHPRPVADLVYDSPSCQLYLKYVF